MQHSLSVRGGNSMRSSIQKSLKLLCCLILGIVLSSLAHADEIDDLNSRLLWDHVGKTSTASAATFLQTMQTNGSWADIPYSSTQSANWPVNKHLERLNVLAVAYRKSSETNFYYKTNVRDAIRLGLDFWLKNGGYINPTNWWYNEIGGPQLMANILLLMEKQITATTLQKGITYASRGDYLSPSRVGQNRIWIAKVFIFLNSLQAVHNLSEIQSAYQAIAGEIKIASQTQEGIKADFSFQQHGNQLQNAGYGMDFASDVVEIMYLSRGLSFNLPASSISLISSYLLSGSQWMMRKNSWDQAAMGRAVSRKGASSTYSMIPVLEQMQLVDPSKATQYENFKLHIQGLKDDSLVGDREFWKADYHVHRQADYFVGLKMSSTRTLRHESLNGENLKGYYLDQGAMMLMRRGTEYREIYPVWDWSRIPGTTTADRAVTPQPTSSLAGSTSFVGGASSGYFGVSVYDQNYDGVTAKKAWFFLRDEIVALGTDISSTNGQRILTNLNQAEKKSDVYVRYKSATSAIMMADGQQSLNQPLYVHHDDVGYMFPENRWVELRTAPQSGSWLDINKVSTDTSIITKTVFNLWFDHQANPSKASYQYIIVPGVTLAEMQTYAQKNAVRVIQNTSLIQAVRNDVTLVGGAVFYQAGTLSFRTGLSIQVDRRCAIVIDESMKDGSIKIAVSNPDHSEAPVTVTLSGAKNTKIVFTMPKGEQAGNSVRKTIY